MNNSNGAWSGNAGSGTVISPRGYILTNYHVISDANGNVYRRSRILVSSDFFSNPQSLYIAEYVDGDPDLDLAVLKVIEDGNGEELSNLNLPYLAIVDFGYLRPDNEISIWGYPDVGGNSITSSRGVISGFTAENFRDGEIGTTEIDSDKIGLNQIRYY